MKYPEHIYDPVRYEVASSIISHEFKKVFGQTDEKTYEKLSKQIYDWPINPDKYSLTKEPRDFWNGVEGIMTGFRLKGVVRFITAENVTWTKEEVELEELIFVTDHFFVNDKKIPTLHKPAKEIVEWLETNGHVEAAMDRVEKSFSSGVPRENDPIYCKKDMEGKYYVHDGNGRVLLALLRGKKTLPAHVGQLNGKEPINYWIPTILIIRFAQFFQKGVIDKNSYTKIMVEVFKESKSAVAEFKDRVPLDDALKTEILATVPSSSNS
jgi:hypothetical protein